MVVRSVNPATGEEVERFEEFTAKEIGVPLARADDAFHRWRRTSFAERAERMHAVAEVFRRHKRAYGETMAQEVGKPIRDGVAGEGQSRSGTGSRRRGSARWRSTSTRTAPPRSSARRRSRRRRRGPSSDTT